MSNIPNDLSAFWMPFTDNRGYKAEPRMFAKAAGMHYWTPDGRQVLDGTGGLWCVNAGHCRAPITQAIAQAAGELDFAPTFQLAHPSVFRLATRLAAITPEGLDHIFFTNSGSESVDTALKIALAYQRSIGQGTRTRLIGRQRGYHGVNFGGVSVGGIVGNRRQFLSLPGVDHLRHTHSHEHQAFTRGQPAWGAHLADELEGLVALHGAETIAAVIVEPMAGSTGVLPPPVGYLEKLRAITAKHGILLIFDEVITGFGRLGAPFAAQAFGVTPDLITMAKGLTNGAVPMGAVAAVGFVHDGIVNNALPGIELAHGYTYSGHPLAAAAGLATLDIYADEGLFERSAALTDVWADAIHGLRDLDVIHDIRTCGFVAGVEMKPKPGAPGARGKAVFHRAFDDGLLVRATADTIALSPPLIASEAEIGEIVDRLRAAIVAAA
ncbi:aspartate aminotransferase family protein [Sphingomonas abietis]|uniref:Aspartate aminotransferase family protein n=1 Tax=Sphingomonas abietis TaxID=3012344 RepID=A0ABY7NI58_9SPHN|nr:aspartate aminotransferase family protein [Sphingomonas abietis]WBO21206.1 aspartate aminotransferase family protein [Sphingomonas abietis]